MSTAEANGVARLSRATAEGAEAVRRLSRMQEAIASRQHTANLIAAFHGPFANYLSHEQYDELHATISKRLGIGEAS